MKTGRIKWYNALQNYGYITLWDGAEIYFHATAIRNPAIAIDLSPGADVSFDVIETRSGFEANNIEVLV